MMPADKVVYEHHFGTTADFTPEEIASLEGASDDDLRALCLAVMTTSVVPAGEPTLFDSATVASLYRQYAVQHGQPDGSEMAIVFQFQGHRFSFDEFVNKLVPRFTECVEEAWDEFPVIGVFDVTADMFDVDSIDLSTALTSDAPAAAVKTGYYKEIGQTPAVPSVPSNIYIHLLLTGLNGADEFALNEFIEDFLTLVERKMMTIIGDEQLEMYGHIEGAMESPFVWVSCERVQRMS